MSTTASAYVAVKGGLPYCEAHPRSEMGDPNVAHRLGWRLVAIRPDGLMIYRRRIFAAFFQPEMTK